MGPAGDSIEYDPNTMLLAEEAIPGKEYSVECICGAQNIWPVQVHDKVIITEKSFAVHENLLVTPPVTLTAQQTEEMKDYAARCVRTLGLKNCVCHVEIRLSRDGKPVLIEVNPRVGGADIKRSLQQATGRSFEQIVLELALGQDPFRHFKTVKKAPWHGMACFFTDKSGVVSATGSHGQLASLPGIISITENVAPGDYVGGDFEEMFAMSVWFSGASWQELSDTYMKMKSVVRYHL